MTVLENVLVGMHSRIALGLLGRDLRAAGVSAEEEAGTAARRTELLAFVGLAREADEVAPRICRTAISDAGDRARPGQRAELLLLDEPAAGMNPAETREMMA